MVCVVHAYLAAQSLSPRIVFLWSSITDAHLNRFVALYNTFLSSPTGTECNPVPVPVDFHGGEDGTRETLESVTTEPGVVVTRMAIKTSASMTPPDKLLENLGEPPGSPCTLRRKRARPTASSRTWTRYI